MFLNSVAKIKNPRLTETYFFSDSFEIKRYDYDDLFSAITIQDSEQSLVLPLKKLDELISLLTEARDSVLPLYRCGCRHAGCTIYSTNLCVPYSYRINK